MNGSRVHQVVGTCFVKLELKSVHLGWRHFFLSQLITRVFIDLNQRGEGGVPYGHGWIAKE